MLGQTVSQPGGHLRRAFGENRSGLAALGKPGKYAGAGAGHHCLRGVLPEPGEMFGDGRKSGAGHRFKIVMTGAELPVAGTDRRRVALEFLSAKNCGCRDVDRRMQDEIGRRRQVDIREGFANAFGKGVLAVNENRDVGTQRQPDFFQFRPCKAGLPEVVEGEQNGCGVRTAAAQATAHR